MRNTNFWKELTSEFGTQIHYQNQMKYFRWKHGLDTNRYTYSEMSQEEFQKRFNLSDIQMFNMKKWESSAQYKRLDFLYKEDQFASDLLQVYDATKKLAEDGDSQAIKNMLLLQKEIKEYRKSIDEFEQKAEEIKEDDGLVI